MFYGALAPMFRRLVFDGDSHVYGNADPANAFPVFLQTYANLQPCSFQNIAQNGWSWQGVLANFVRDAVPFAPTSTGGEAIFHLHVGSNNIAGSDAAGLNAGVASIIDLAHDTYGFLISATSPWTDPAWDATQNSQLASYAASLLANAKVSSYLDGRAMFPTPNTGPYFLSNNNHLSPTGQAFYAQTLQAKWLTTGLYL